MGFPNWVRDLASRFTKPHGLRPRPSLSGPKACLTIEMPGGEGTAECRGEGGHDYGKAGKTFRSGDTIHIWIRFGHLLVGNQTLRVIYYKYDPAARDYQEQFDQLLTFANRQPDWSYSFHSKAARSGRWRVEPYLKWNGKFYPYGRVEYDVDGVLE